jgi:hypothetical protein
VHNQNNKGKYFADIEGGPRYNGTKGKLGEPPLIVTTAKFKRTMIEFKNISLVGL